MSTDDQRSRYEPTTTHARWGEGDPRLNIVRDDERFTFALTADVVRIGSDAHNELRLDDTDPVHAEIAHDEKDEYVLTLFGPGETNTGPQGSRGRRIGLRSCAREPGSPPGRGLSCSHVRSSPITAALTAAVRAASSPISRCSLPDRITGRTRIVTLPGPDTKRATGTAWAAIERQSDAAAVT